jgi:hypothetical protein
VGRISPQDIHRFELQLTFLLKLDSDTMNRFLSVIQAWPLHELELHCERHDARATSLVDSFVRALAENTHGVKLFYSAVAPSPEVFGTFLQRKCTSLEHVQINQLVNDKLVITNSQTRYFYGHGANRRHELVLAVPPQLSSVALAALQRTVTVRQVVQEFD